MPVIFSPKTNKHTYDAFHAIFKLENAQEASRIWHGNFQDALYSVYINEVKIWIFFTGYSGAAVGQAIFEYDKHLRGLDSFPSAFFIGSCYATKQSGLDLNDIVIPVDSYSPDSFEQAVYKNCEIAGIRYQGAPSSHLVDLACKSALKRNIILKKVKVYSRISPGILSTFKTGYELMMDGLWTPFALEEGDREGFDVGEYECNAFLSTCNLLKIPPLAILDVKDKRIGLKPEDYIIRKSENGLYTYRIMLSLIKDIVGMFYRKGSGHA